MDQVKLHTLSFQTIVGILPHERLQPQRVDVDVTLDLDLAACGNTGNLEQGIDYAAVMDLLMFLAKAGQFELLESYCVAACSLLLHLPNGPRPTRVELEVRKPDVLAPHTTPAIRMVADATRFGAPVFADDAQGARCATLVQTPTLHVQRVAPTQGTRWQPPAPSHVHRIGDALSTEQRNRATLKRTRALEAASGGEAWLVITRSETHANEDAT